MTYGFPSLSNDSSCCGSGYFDVCLQLDLFFGPKEVLLLQLTIYPSLSLNTRETFSYYHRLYITDLF